jgi:O-antigen ligase
MVFCSTFSIALTQIAYYTALIVWLSLILTKKEKFQPTPLDLWFSLYLVIELVSTIFAYDRIDALLHIQKRLLLLPIVYLIFRYIDTRERIMRILMTLFISAAIVGLLSSISILIQFSAYSHYIKRFDIYNHYMTIGGISMFMLLLMIPFSLNRQITLTQRILLIIGVAAILLTLIFTFTRSSWLGLIIGIIVLVMLRFKKLLYLFLVVVVGVVIIGSPELHVRFLSIFDPTDPSNDLRLRMWNVGLKIFQDNPILGVGDISLNPLNDAYSQHTMDFGHMHNNFVQWLVTTGTVGFVIVILWFIKIWKLFWSAYRKMKDDWLYGSFTAGAIAVFVGFHVNGLFEWNFGDAEIYTLFWIIVGLVLSVRKQNDEAPRLQTT